MKRVSIIYVVLILLCFIDATYAQIQATWSTNAGDKRLNIGQRFTYICPANGSPSNVWGTDVYTDDSSICTAAVHAGLISFHTGGVVTIEIRPGLPSYRGSTRNGVSSRDYGQWNNSFIFVGASGNIQPTPQYDYTVIDWRANAANKRGLIGQRFTYLCPANGTPYSAWGTDIYTDDSSICTAAVHAGLITFQSGGLVTIEIRSGQQSYAGSSRYGVTTNGYGKWDGSFIFVGSPNYQQPITQYPEYKDPISKYDYINANWVTNASDKRGMIGQRFTYICPPNGSPYKVWGTDIYTDDSSVCTAAVHAGLISLQAGGMVTIEIRAGQPSYIGTTRNGINSMSWGSYHGSFIFVYK